MRNLKKVLALALATVMLLGMMAMASAADYNDEAQIADKYDAAVDVMSAIGVFNGSKGNFNPKGTLTRAEAAKVITYVALTKANADKLGTADAPFADVAADNWAAPSIAYAKNLGIVSGSAGNYRPNDTLTGYEFAKMLLVVAGYNADAEGFKGSLWSTNVDAAALRTGLKAGLAIDMGAAITREEACQMAFNALEVTCVAYTGGTTLETGDTKIVIGGNRYEVEATDTEAYKLAGNDDKQQLVEKLYPTLKVDTADKTAFGYAVKTWALNGKEVGTEANYTVLASWPGTAATVTTGALYNIAGATTTDVYANGNDVDGTVVTVAKGGTAKPLANYAGALVEYVNNNGVKQLLVTEAYPAKVASVTAATASADRYVTLTVYASDDHDAALSINLTTEAYAKGDWVIVSLNNDQDAITAHKAAETVYGTVTQIAQTSGATTSIYMDGTAIPVANAAYATFTDTDETNVRELVPTLNLKGTVILNNGYAVGYTGEATKASLSSYVYLAKAITEATGVISDEYGTAYKPAQVVYMDGTTGIVKLAADTAASAGAGDDIAKGIYKVTGTTAIKTLAPVDATVDADSSTDFYGKTTITGGNFTMKATDKTLDVDGITKAYYTATSKVLFVTGSGTTLKTEIVAAPMATTIAADSEYVVFSKNATADAYEVEVVVVEAAMSTNNADLYYVTNTDLGDVYIAATKATVDQVAIYDVKTGEKSVVLVADADAVVKGYSTFTVDANGVYTFAPYSTGVSVYNADSTVKLYNGLMNVTGGVVSGSAMTDKDATEAVIIDISGDTPAVKTLANLKDKASAEFSVVVNGTTGKVTSIVVTG